MQKILIVIESMEVGGAEMDILRNFPAIDKDPDFEVIICLFGRLGPLYGQLKKAGLRVLFKPHKKPRKNPVLFLLDRLRNRIAGIRFIRSCITKEQPDIVHCFLPKAYLLTCIAKIFGNPAIRRSAFVMSRLSMNYYMQDYPMGAWFEKAICHKHAGFKRFIGNSKAITRQLIDEGCDPDKVTLLYNGIDVHAFACERHEKHFVKEPFEMVCVGNLHRYKGYDDLIEALAMLDKDPEISKPWILKIAGADKEDNQARLQAKINALGLEDRITFTGSIQNIAEFLPKAHLFIHPSHTEGLPNAIIEAMSSGLPIVATRTGGIPELIEEGHNGFLVDTRSSKQLYHAIQNAMSEKPSKLNFMGAISKALAFKQFTLDKSISKYKDTYKAIS